MPTGTSNSSARAQYGSNRGSAGDIPAYWDPTSPRARNRPALSSPRSHVTSGNSVPLFSNTHVPETLVPPMHGNERAGRNRFASTLAHGPEVSGRVDRKMYRTFRASNIAIVRSGGNIGFAWTCMSMTGGRG